MATARQIGDRIRQRIAEGAAKTMIEARQRVTAATPVDTEHAASNWVLSVSQPYTAVCGSRESVSYEAQEEGDQRVRDYDGRDLAAGRQIYLRNNVFYMIFLNRGWSRQAPANFVALALLARGATRLMPRGSKRAAAAALRRVARDALKGARKR